MTTYRMPQLTADQLRTIASEAVADVARQKITTSKSFSAPKPVISRVRESQGPALFKAAASIMKNPNASGIQKRQAGSVLSQAEGRGYFKDAFNKARKG